MVSGVANFWAHGGVYDGTRMDPTGLRGSVHDWALAECLRLANRASAWREWLGSLDVDDVHVMPYYFAGDLRITTLRRSGKLTVKLFRPPVSLPDDPAAQVDLAIADFHAIADTLSAKYRVEVSPEAPTRELVQAEIDKVLAAVAADLALAPQLFEMLRPRLKPKGAAGVAAALRVGRGLGDAFTAAIEDGKIQLTAKEEKLFWLIPSR